jgi:ABC-2 type transport system ATP-binding protein
MAAMSPIPRSAEPAAFAARSLGKRYGRTWALRDCTLELPSGRVAALVGPNGAGKTTLMNMAVGLAAPSTGAVEIFGRPVPVGGGEALADVGFVAQDHPMYQGFSVAEMLRLGRALNRRWDDSLARERLREVGVPLERRVGHLSGGQQAQVSLDMALAKRPRLLILDEPLASLDPLARREFTEVLMSAVRSDGLTALFSSHVLSELEMVCDYLVLMREGLVRVAGSVKELLLASGMTLEQLILSHLRGDRKATTPLMEVAR